MSIPNSNGPHCFNFNMLRHTGPFINAQRSNHDSNALSYTDDVVTVSRLPTREWQPSPNNDGSLIRSANVTYCCCHSDRTRDLPRLCPGVLWSLSSHANQCQSMPVQIGRAVHHNAPTCLPRGQAYIRCQWRLIEAVKHLTTRPANTCKFALSCFFVFRSLQMHWTHCYPEHELYFRFWFGEWHWKSSRGDFFCSKLPEIKHSLVFIVCITHAL